ncbi:MAG: hypothetical protein JO053_16060 [Acidobacteria bacterium]|nr:hypothetical protein [Acidobacteriota bacterium]
MNTNAERTRISVPGVHFADMRRQVSGMQVRDDHAGAAADKVFGRVDRKTRRHSPGKSKGKDTREISRETAEAVGKLVQAAFEKFGGTGDCEPISLKSKVQSPKSKVEE